jgi:hypothetical protein
VRGVSRNDVRAAEISVQRAEFPAPGGVIVETGLGQIEFLAARIEGRLQLVAMHPAFFAAWHTDLEPVRAPHEKLDLLAALGHEENRIAGAGTGVQIDVGICDRDLPIVPFRACCCSNDEKLA